MFRGLNCNGKAAHRDLIKLSPVGRVRRTSAVFAERIGNLCFAAGYSFPAPQDPLIALGEIVGNNQIRRG